MFAAGFSWPKGYAPLDFGGAPPSAAACAGCHAQEAREWRTSGHARAWVDDLVLVGFALEPLTFCVDCHAPRPDQRGEVLANLAWYRSLAPGSPALPGSVERRPEPHTADGVDCAACHWRDGAIVAAEVSGTAPHRVVAEPALRSGELCVGCHDFPVPVTVDGVTTATAVPMQTTGTEWRAWRAAGGDRTCPDCHLPGGGHTFPGARDRDALRGSIRAEPVPGALLLSTVGVGHDLPTGDVFRRLGVEVTTGDGPWTVVAELSRRFGVDPDGDVPRQFVSGDDRLRPGEVRRIDVPAGAARWRVVWHDGSARDEALGLLDPTDIVEVLHEGTWR